MDYPNDTVAQQMFAEFRNNPTLDVVEYVADNLPLFKDEIFSMCWPSEEWERYEHISETIVSGWRGIKSGCNQKSDMHQFQFGIDAVNDSLNREHRLEAYFQDNDIGRLDKFLDYNESTPNWSVYSSYLTTCAENGSFVQGVFSAYSKVQPKFHDLWEKTVGKDRPTVEFVNAIYALPILVGYLEPNRIFHAEMLMAMMFRRGVDNFLICLPEYEDTGSRRWVSAQLNKFSSVLAANTVVSFGGPINN